jgi:uncharacterized membrane protein
MSSTIVKYVSVFLVSMVKFFGGPLAGVSLNLSFLETVLVSVAGMMASVVVFSTVGIAANKWYKQKFQKKKKAIFTRRNRRIVKVYRTFGIGGIAFLTPLILSPIIGTIFAVLLGASRGKIFFTMLWSALFWGVVYTLVLSAFNKASFWEFFKIV